MKESRKRRRRTLKRVKRPGYLASLASIKNFFNEDKTFEFSVNGQTVAKFGFDKKSSEFQYKFEEDDLVCIDVTVDIGHKVVELTDYYFTDSENQCTRPPHSAILNHFLNFVAYATDSTTIILNDGSRKALNHCNPLYSIFSLAGNLTFYERYGFENYKFTEVINKLRGERISDKIRNAARDCGIVGETYFEIASKYLKVCRGSTKPACRISLTELESTLHKSVQAEYGSPKIYFSKMPQPIWIRMLQNKKSGLPVIDVVDARSSTKKI
jgi:hypothetical protein